MSNMNLWNAVKTTDVSATKANSQGGRRSTSINGYSMIEQATKQWGPLGGKWWYEVVEQRFDHGAPILNAEGVEICKTVTHTCVLDLHIEGNRPIRQYGHTPYIYKSKHGPITDGEADKKSLMDALKKALSMLGFSADVFLGEFDDVNYVNQITAQQQIEKSSNKDAEIQNKRDELVSYISGNKSTIQKSVTKYEAKKVHDLCVAHLSRQASIPQLSDIANQGIKALAIALSNFKPGEEK